MTYYSYKDLEAIGNRVVAAYAKLPSGQRDGVFQIDPVHMARELFHLSVEHFHLSQDGSVLGLTSPMEVGVEVFDDQMESVIYFLDGRTILMEKELLSDKFPLGRYNFTVMHELAHHLLFSLDANPARLRNLTARSDERDWPEWQADTLASVLLMPEKLVRSVLNYVGVHGGIYLLDSALCPETYRKFRDAAAILGVSKTALAIRLKRLGLLRHNDLSCPGGILDIYCEGGEPCCSNRAS